MSIGSADGARWNLKRYAKDRSAGDSVACNSCSIPSVSPANDQFVIVGVGKTREKVRGASDWQL